MAEWRRGSYLVSTDPARLDVDAVYRFLSQEAYWAEGRPREIVERSIASSLIFGLYDEQSEGQLGFARAVTDRATFAWICDVFVIPVARGLGLGVWLMECVVSHPELANLRRLFLATRDAHDLSRKVGFTELPDPGRWMIRSAAPRMKESCDS